MLEDLFKVVKTRFNGSEKAEVKSAAESNKIPDDLLFKCPRCRCVVFEDEIRAVIWFVRDAVSRQTYGSGASCYYG